MPKIMPTEEIVALKIKEGQKVKIIVEVDGVDVGNKMVTVPTLRAKNNAKVIAKLWVVDYII